MGRRSTGEGMSAGRARRRGTARGAALPFPVEERTSNPAAEMFAARLAVVDAARSARLDALLRCTACGRPTLHPGGSCERRECRAVVVRARLAAARAREKERAREQVAMLRARAEERLRRVVIEEERRLEQRELRARARAAARVPSSAGAGDVPSPGASGDESSPAADRDGAAIQRRLDSTSPRVLRARITVLVPANPHALGSRPAAMHDLARRSGTVGEFIAAGGGLRYLGMAAWRGILRVDPAR